MSTTIFGLISKTNWIFWLISICNFFHKCLLRSNVKDSRTRRFWQRLPWSVRRWIGPCSVSKRTTSSWRNRCRRCRRSWLVWSRSMLRGKSLFNDIWRPLRLICKHSPFFIFPNFKLPTFWFGGFSATCDDGWAWIFLPRLIDITSRHHQENDLETERLRSAQLQAERLLEARERAHRQQIKGLEEQVRSFADRRFHGLSKNSRFWRCYCFSIKVLITQTWQCCEVWRLFSAGNVFAGYILPEMHQLTFCCLPVLGCSLSDQIYHNRLPVRVPNICILLTTEDLYCQFSSVKFSQQCPQRGNYSVRSFNESETPESPIPNSVEGTACCDGTTNRWRLSSF